MYLSASPFLSSVGKYRNAHGADDVREPARLPTRASALQNACHGVHERDAGAPAASSGHDEQGGRPKGFRPAPFVGEC
jgi:hypothetical protein